MSYPAHLRLTFKEQGKGWIHEEHGGRYETITAPLAFAQTYEPDLKTFASKQKTQDKWAYGNFVYDDQGFVYTKRMKFNREKRMDEYCGNDLVKEYLQPRIISNVPMNGFQFVKSVTRYSTSNKVWRVLDPRGFELEISTANLEELMMDCVIDHGIIKSTCVWCMPRGKAYLMRADIL